VRALEALQSEPSASRSAFPSAFRKATRARTIQIAALAVIAAVVTGGISLLIPKSYRSEARILPNLGASGSSSLMALAAGSGLADLLSGQLGAAENPILTYPEILLSRTLLERTLESSVALTPTRSVVILDALEAQGATSRQRVEDGVRILRNAIDVRANPRSGLIAVSAVTPDSVLSAGIVIRMLEELDRFNLDTRTSRGRATREFVEGRMSEAQRQLASAEQSLASFRSSNIHIGNAPQLALQLERLEREVAVRSELFLLLSRQYEMARIEEKRDTPTFSVIDPARPPVRKYRPKVMLNAFVAGVSAVVLAVLFDFYRRTRSRPHAVPAISASM
jgi:uncharacterized protein involved in exopolysaccharide biosynthesis